VAGDGPGVRVIGLGQQHRELVAPKAGEYVVIAQARAHRLGTLTQQVIALLMASGREIPVRVSSFLVNHPETGEPWARATIQHDISEEQRVMADLRRSQERYQAQFQSLPVPTYSGNAATTISCCWSAMPQPSRSRAAQSPI
jgi:PAS domain-containing protein